VGAEMPERLSPEDVAGIPLICPGYRIRVAERLATRFYNARFKKVGLSAVQFGLLVGIETSDQPMVAELAEQSGADPSTLARNLHLLESDGLVIGKGGRGRFGKRFVLSSKGRNLLERALDIWQRAYDDLVTAVGSPRIEEGMNFLTAVEEAAKKQLSYGKEDVPRRKEKSKRDTISRSRKSRAKTYARSGPRTHVGRR
jgi:DNA-binding MarR family transcriptional regulator